MQDVAEGLQYKLRLKMRCKGFPIFIVQAFSSHGDNQSGPAALLGQSLLSLPLTMADVHIGGGAFSPMVVSFIGWIAEGMVRGAVHWGVIKPIEEVSQLVRP